MQDANAMPAEDALFKTAANASVKAIINWDPAVITEALDCGFEVHISTQANVSNWQTVEFYRK